MSWPAAYELDPNEETILCPLVDLLNALRRCRRWRGVRGNVQKGAVLVRVADDTPGVTVPLRHSFPRIWRQVLGADGHQWFEGTRWDAFQGVLYLADVPGDQDHIKAVGLERSFNQLPALGWQLFEDAQDGFQLTQKGRGFFDVH